jgi:hypothetical protein
MLRYHTTAERLYRRAKGEFFELRKLRLELTTEKTERNEADSGLQPIETTSLTLEQNEPKNGPSEPTPDPDHYTGEGEVSGAVLRKDRPVPEAAVGLMCDNGDFRYVITGTSGKFRFPALPTANYNLFLVNPLTIRNIKQNRGLDDPEIKRAHNFFLEPGATHTHDIHHF